MDGFEIAGTSVPEMNDLGPINDNGENENSGGVHGKPNGWLICWKRMITGGTFQEPLNDG